MNASGSLLTKVTKPFMRFLMMPLHVVATPNRCLGLSLPRRAAVFIFLMWGLLAVACYWQWSSKLEDLGRTATVIFIAIAALVVVSTACVTEYMIKTWLDYDVSGYPDIDEAWAHGLAELREAGLSLGEMPLFLVLGVPDDAQAGSLMGASTMNLTVNSVPSGENTALRWFAGPDAAVLVVSGASCLSRLAAKAGEPADVAEMPMENMGGTMAPPPSEFGDTAGGFGGPESFSMERNSPSVPPRSMLSTPSQPGGHRAGVGTLTPDFWEQAEDQLPLGGPPGSSVARWSAPITLTKEQSETATARLEYVCRLLLKERLPLCPINGVLTILPFDLVARGEQDAGELGNSVKTDLKTLRTVLQLRCQVIALFGGMEHTEGFPELMRRLGSKIANEQQFGKGYNPRCPAIKDEVAAVARQACGAFEEWAYYLLLGKKGDQRSNPRGNRQLYSLVCRIRSLQQRLGDVIVNGFASDGGSHAERPQFFSGCYFAATGDKDDRRAFITGVFKNRLLAQDNIVEWTRESLEENAWFQRIANWLVVTDMLLIAATVAMVYYIWNNGGRAV